MVCCGGKGKNKMVVWEKEINKKIKTPNPLKRGFNRFSMIGIAITFLEDIN